MIIPCKNCDLGLTIKDCTTTEYKECFERTNKPMRKSKDKYYLDIALEVSKRSTCLRRQYGAVIVKNDEIIATGYNGSPRGSENCTDRGFCRREALSVPHGERYELCESVHAEMNAIISASRKEMMGSVMYLAGTEHSKVIEAIPCTICARLIKNAGIYEVINKE